MKVNALKSEAPVKRNLFEELQEGFVALAEARSGKQTLKTHAVKRRDAPTLSPGHLVALRERLKLSRPVLARYLRINERTLENWEQGRARPNAQAAVLISLVERFPDTVERLASID